MRATLPWAPQLGLEFYLRMDGYAWLFALLVSLMGALVVLYARYYMSPEDPVPRFFSFLMAFMGAMLGIVLSGNLIQLVVFWELTSLTSFMLIALLVSPRRCAARRTHGADRHGRGRFVPARSACVMLGDMAGGYDLDVVLAAGDAIRAHDSYPDHARADRARRADQERAVSLSFLAAARNGGADAGFRLSAFGDDGESGRVPARAPVACAARHGRVVLDRLRRGPELAAARRASLRCSSAT